MAKLKNLRPLVGKRTLRISIRNKSTKFDLEDLFDEIDKDIPGILPDTKHNFFFRIKNITMDAGVSNGVIAGSTTSVIIFGREYFLSASTQRGVDSSYSPEPTEFWGLWHDAKFLQQALDKGASSGANEVPVIAGSEDLQVEIVVEYIHKAVLTGE